MRSDDDDDDERSGGRSRTRTPVRSNRSSTKTMTSTSTEPTPVVPIDDASTHPTKGEYSTDQVIQLKESFQPIINEAASYGHLDIVRKLIEVSYFSVLFLFLSSPSSPSFSVVKVFIRRISYNERHCTKHVSVATVI